MNKVIVTGSRDWHDEPLLIHSLESAMPHLVIQGGAKGADYIALSWARFFDVKHVTMKANWEKFGKRAGILRNMAMCDAYPDAHVLAFRLNSSPGTTHCISYAREKGMHVTVYDQIL